MKILSKLIVNNLFIIWLINVKENLELDKIDKFKIQNHVQWLEGNAKYILTYKTDVHKCGVL